MTRHAKPFLWALCMLSAFATGRMAAQAPSEPQPVYGRALLRTWVPPEYPKDALKERLSARVSLRLVVDAKGVVASSRVLDASDPRFVEAAQSAVKKWAFSPALDASRPVACSMDATVVFSPDEAARKRAPGSFLPTGEQVPVLAPMTEASLDSSPVIDFPDALFDRKLSGKARYRCTVLPDGSVARPRITAATHAEFVLPALRALRELKYAPRMQGDLPVESEVDGVLKFDLARKDSDGALAANLVSAPDGSAPSAQLDPLVVVDPVYPRDLLLKGTAGTATVLFTVDEDGSTSNARVRDASDPEFGAALVAAVELSAFTPPGLDGHGVSVELMRRADFPSPACGTDAGSDAIAGLLADLRSGKIAGGGELDGKPVPLYTRAPRYPAALRRAGRPAGQAMVEFIIDQDGRARLPQTVSATDERFGWAAATAVSQWVFEAPRRKGEPVAVRLQIPFAFKPPAD